MKRGLLFAFVAVTVILTACAGKQATGMSSNDQEQVSTDESLEKQQADPDETVAESEQSQIIKKSEDPEQLYSAEIDEMGKHASDIIIGTVKSLAYKSVNGSPWTEYTLTVEESIKGQKKAGDQVLLYTYGGRLPLKEYLKSEPGNKRYDKLSDSEKEKTIVDISIGEELMEVGEEYVLFISPTPEYSPLPKNVYEKVTVGSGTSLKLSDDALSASRVNPQTGVKEEIALETIKKYK